MTKEISPIKPHESSYAAKMLNAMAGSINTQLAAFSSWMVAGFGAVLGLLVANVDTIAPFLPPTTIGCAVKLFLVAVVLNVFKDTWLPLLLEALPWERKLNQFRSLRKST